MSFVKKTDSRQKLSFIISSSERKKLIETPSTSFCSFLENTHLLKSHYSKNKGKTISIPWDRMSRSRISDYIGDSIQRLETSLPLKASEYYKYLYLDNY